MLRGFARDALFCTGRSKGLRTMGLTTMWERDNDTDNDVTFAAAASMGVNKSGLLLQFFYELMPGIERKLSYARRSFFIDTPNNARLQQMWFLKRGASINFPFKVPRRQTASETLDPDFRGSLFVALRLAHCIKSH
jgi:hypothetical protein